MTTNPTRPGSRPNLFEPPSADPPAPATVVKRTQSIDKERLEALRSELDEGDNHWPIHIAETIDEDYRQLMRDFGFH